MHAAAANPAASGSAGTCTPPSSVVAKVRATQYPDTPGSAATSPPPEPTAPYWRVTSVGAKGTDVDAQPSWVAAASPARSGGTVISRSGRDQRAARGASWLGCSSTMTSDGPAPCQCSAGASSGSSPTVTTTSASAMPPSSKSRACSPAVARWWRLRQSNTPLAPQVLSTPRLPAAAKAWSPLTASSATTPGPASTIGLLAAVRAATASSLTASRRSAVKADGSTSGDGAPRSKPSRIPPPVARWETRSSRSAGSETSMTWANSPPGLSISALRVAARLRCTR